MLGGRPPAALPPPLRLPPGPSPPSPAPAARLRLTQVPPARGRRVPANPPGKERQGRGLGLAPPAARGRRVPAQALWKGRGLGLASPPAPRALRTSVGEGRRRVRKRSGVGGERSRALVTHPPPLPQPLFWGRASSRSLRAPDRKQTLQVARRAALESVRGFLLPLPLRVPINRRGSALTARFRPDLRGRARAIVLSAGLSLAPQVLKKRKKKAVSARPKGRERR